MQEPKIRVAIFSYNRPEHLANLLTSIRDLWPQADVVVYDDNSTHRGMKSVLESCGFPVRTGPGGSGRHGGLYSNMQQAYEESMAEGFEYLLTLQDDMQLVRPVTEELLGKYFQDFGRDQALTQIEPRFAKTPLKRRKKSKTSGSSSQNKPIAFKAYLDVGIFKISRLSRLGWSFNVEGSQIISGEQTLSIRAAKLGMKKGDPATPFVMHLPFPHLYRHLVRLPRLSGLSRKIFRFEYMSPGDIERMDRRPAGTPAYWRKYLRIDGATWFDRLLLSGKDDSKILA